jgi:hypothetical protein
MLEALRPSELGTQIIMDQQRLEHFLTSVRSVVDDAVVRGHETVLVCAPALRPAIHRLVAPHVAGLPVLNYQEVTSAQVVVLPYREMHNSGAVLVALSLDRPVVVPRTPVNQALSDEVGPGWIFMYDGALTAEVVDIALSASAPQGRRPPDLRHRDWSAVGQGHYQAYLQAVAITRAPPRRELRYPVRTSSPSSNGTG